MKIFAAIFFMMAGAVLITQSVYIAHLKWVWNPESALDKYGSVKEERIPPEKTIEELIGEYATLRQTVGAYEDADELPDGAAKDGLAEQIRRLRALKSAIDKMEDEQRSLTRMRYYWACGFLIAMVGCFLGRRVNMLLALPFLIAGFIDMIAYSTLVSRTLHSLTTEKFLTYQFVLSVVTFVILLVVTYVTKVFDVAKELR